jgi:hypothetical protein
LQDRESVSYTPPERDAFLEVVVVVVVVLFALSVPRRKIWEGEKMYTGSSSDLDAIRDPALSG